MAIAVMRRYVPFVQITDAVGKMLAQPFLEFQLPRVGVVVGIGVLHYPAEAV